jgi:hypothetical protein
MQRLALEILAQRSMARVIVLQRVVSVCAQRTGKHSDVPEDGFQRLVENIGHLVLEVLGCDERIQKTEPGFALGGDDFAGSACDAGVVVEGFPEVVECGCAGLRADVE